MKKQTPKPKPALTREQVFAPKSHVIRVKDGAFFTAPTLDQRTFSGPYKSLQACCSAIARRLGEEFATRRSKVEKSHAKRR